MYIFYEKDTDINLIKNKKILMIGYGSQGRAHALNLKDSGVKSIDIVLRKGSKTIETAKADGFSVLFLEEEPLQADIYVMAAPDETHAMLYENYISSTLKEGSTLLFIHGLSIHFGLIKAKSDSDVIMVSPKGPGPMVREEYEKGRGLVSLFAVAQDYSKNAQNIALAYAAAIGSGRSAIFKTSFKEECEADLFGEQAVLCGGLVHLVRAGYETLTEAGFSPEIAYFECVHEIKLVADLIYKHGIAHMNTLISNTAEWGEYIAGSKVISENTKKDMKAILKNIQSGNFAKEWAEEYAKGLHNFYAYRKKYSEESIEKTGEKIRALMPWIKQ